VNMTKQSGQKRTQHGGTALGLIIGLVVGLGIALAVALYMNKAPSNIGNKAQNRSGESDAQESKKLRDWDPNAPLAGKSSSKASASAEASKDKPDESKPGKDAVKTPEKTEPKSEGKAENKPAKSSDPLGDLAKTKSAETQAESGDKWLYVVQVGAFKTEQDAQTQKAKVALLGFDVKVSEKVLTQRTVYRVRTGGYDKKDDAEKVKQKLESAGIEANVLRVPRNPE